MLDGPVGTTTAAAGTPMPPGALLGGPQSPVNPMLMMSPQNMALPPHIQQLMQQQQMALPQFQHLIQQQQSMVLQQQVSLPGKRSTQ